MLIASAAPLGWGASADVTCVTDMARDLVDRRWVATEVIADVAVATVGIGPVSIWSADVSAVPRWLVDES